MRGEWGFSSDERPFGDRFGTLSGRAPTYTVSSTARARSPSCGRSSTSVTARHGVVTAALVPAYRERAGARQSGALTVRDPGDVMREYRARALPIPPPGVA